jgi:hypothetical protein
LLYDRVTVTEIKVYNDDDDRVRKGVEDEVRMLKKKLKKKEVEKILKVVG